MGSTIQPPDVAVLYRALSAVSLAELRLLFRFELATATQDDDRLTAASYSGRIALIDQILRERGLE